MKYMSTWNFLVKKKKDSEDDEYINCERAIIISMRLKISVLQILKNELGNIWIHLWLNNNLHKTKIYQFLKIFKKKKWIQK